MTLYTCVSVAGSLPVIACFILWILQKQSYNYYLGKRLLLIGMFFYLFPFQLVKHVLPKQTAPVLNSLLDANVEQSFYKVKPVESVMSPGKSIWIPKWLSIIMIVWLCCIIVFAVYQIVKYRVDIRRLLARSEKMVVEVDGEYVEVLVNKDISTPYTVGFIKQSVIVPEKCLTHPCFPMFYRHENQHRRNHDSLMKLICIIIICIHWLNLTAILLLFLYNVTTEYLCDARATENCTDDEKKKYAQALIELSTAKEPFSVVWRNNLSGSEKLMRRRINYMMKKRMVRTGIAIVVSMLMVLASTSTIFAYEPMFSTNESTAEIFDSGDFGTFSDTDEADGMYFGDSDGVFVYEDGTQVPVIEAGSTYAICNHILVDGYYHLHKSNSSGGCTVTVYNAKRCSRCGYVEVSTVSSTHTYTVCPHK